MMRPFGRRLVDAAFWLTLAGALLVGMTNDVHGLVGGRLTLVGSVALGIPSSMLAAGAISVYAHRFVAHGAITQFHPALSLPLRAWIWVSTGTNCRRWAAVHIQHHRHADSVGDPHSPVIESSAIRLNPWSNWGRYREALDDESIWESSKPSDRAEPDRWDHAIFDRTARGPWIGGAVFTVLLGPIVGFLAWFLHTALFLVYAATVNSLGHAYGYQRYTNHGARYTGNSFLLAIFTGGESFHNNHHGDPHCPYLARRWWEFFADWPSAAIWMCSRLGLVQLRKQTRVVPAIQHPQYALTARALGQRGGEGSSPVETSSVRRRDFRQAELLDPRLAGEKQRARAVAGVPRRDRAANRPRSPEHPPHA